MGAGIGLLIAFAIGAGSSIIDVDVELQWATPNLAGLRDLESKKHPLLQTSEDPSGGTTTLVAGLEAAAIDGSIREVVEVKEAEKQ